MIMTNMTHNNLTNKDFIHLYKVDNHLEHKEKLLGLIAEQVEENDIQPNEMGYLYDFNKPKLERKYQLYWDHVLWPYCIEHGEEYGLMIHDQNPNMRPWFHQYTQNSSFGWHQHNGHWAIIYYLELPDKKAATEFLNYGTVEVEEGNLLFFPTFLVHRSPVIKSNKRKTIISCNIDYMVDREYVNEHYGLESYTRIKPS